MSPSLWLPRLKRQFRIRQNRKSRLRGKRGQRYGSPAAPPAISTVAETLEDRTLLTTFTVVNTDDSGAGSLRDAIEQANENEGADAIVFDAALAGQSFMFSEQLKIRDELSIVGLGADQMTFQIDGGEDQHFSLIYIGDYDDDNIYSVDISGISFDGVGQGRAIYSTKNLTVTDCEFTNMSVRGSGGAIFASRYLTVQNCSFLNNETGGDGGAISYINNNVNSKRDFLCIISDSYFYNNKAEYNGGGVSVSSDRTYLFYDYYHGLELSSSTFIQNECIGTGGGVAVINAWAEISDSKFFSNEADRGGGVGQQLLSHYQNTKTATKISDCEFSWNSTNYGGGFFFAKWPEAVYDVPNYESELILARCEFRENTAALRGGGLYLSTSDYATQALEIDVFDSILSYNSAGTEGGGVFSYATSLHFESCLINDNSAVEAGGGFYSSRNLRILNSTVSHNTTEKLGGAFYSSGFGTYLSFSACTVVLNSAGESGGAVYIESTSSSNFFKGATNSIIAGNAAPQFSQTNRTLELSYCIFQDSIDGLLDPVLRDNGGNTKTHALLPGSLAIDAGDNSYFEYKDIVFDVRGDGHLRIVNGTVDIGAFEVQGPFTQLDLRIVDTPTTASINGEVASLPENKSWIDEWGSYWLEIWISTPLTTELGILSVALELTYNTAVTTATSIEYGAAFSLNQTGTINDQTGTIENLSADTSLAAAGDDQHVLFARIRFESLVEDKVDLDLEINSLNQQFPELTVNHPVILFSGSSISEEVRGTDPATQIFANPYDLNDDGAINFSDLLWFATVYQQKPSESSSDYAWFADYNQDDRVSFQDLILFAANYGKRKSGDTPVTYPQNYPAAWNQLFTVAPAPPPSQSATTIQQSTAESLLDSTVAEITPQLPPAQQQTLSEIDIKVVDLANESLGRAAAGTIYIDVNAAGYGWFIDTTPAEHSEFSPASDLTLIALPDSEAAGLIDFRTVILHELSHLLGYEHDTDGLMQETLAPGVRYLADWESDTDEFFGSLTDETALSIF